MGTDARAEEKDRFFGQLFEISRIPLSVYRVRHMTNRLNLHSIVRRTTSGAIRGPRLVTALTRKTLENRDTK